MTEPLIRAENLGKTFGAISGFSLRPQSSGVRAVDGVSFSIDRGETVAVVGESGCGKSTLARLVTMIEQPTSGSLNIAGNEIVGASAATLLAAAASAAGVATLGGAATNWGRGKAEGKGRERVRRAE